MNENFDRCWSFVQKWEGGATVSRDPDDPGGVTKWGISQKAHPDIDIPNLTEDEAKEIARREYWVPMDCANSDWPSDLLGFDTAFSLGVKAAQGLGSSFHQFMCDRIFYYVRLVRQHPTLGKYLQGWLNRCYDLYKTATL